MAKKKNEPIIIDEFSSPVEEPKVNTNPDGMWSIADRDAMLRLFKIAALSPQQVNEVVSLYRKYVNPAQPFTMSGCGNCQSTLSMIYSNLRDWYGRNANNFY